MSFTKYLFYECKIIAFKSYLYNITTYPFTTNFAEDRMDEKSTSKSIVLIFLILSLIEFTYVMYRKNIAPRGYFSCTFPISDDRQNGTSWTISGYDFS